jgi:hypothetical protein
VDKVVKADVNVQANHFPTLNLKVAVGNPSHDGKTIMNVVATLGIQFYGKTTSKTILKQKCSP